MKYKILYLVMALILLVSMGLALIPTPVQAAGDTPLYAFIATYQDDTVSIFDVSDPTDPSFVTKIDITNPEDVFVSGSYLYITYNFNQLAIYDVSTPSTPVYQSTIGGTGSPYYMGGVAGVFVVDDVAYTVSLSDDALTTIDVSSPTSPSLLDSIYGTGSPNYLWAAEDVVVVDDLAYVASANDCALVIFDISDPSNIVLEGEIHGDGSPNYLCGVERIQVVDNYAYLSAWCDDVVTVVDVIDPSNPVHEDTTGNAYAPIGLDILGNYMYVTEDDGDSFAVFDISDLDSITQVDDLTGGGSPYYFNGLRDVFVVGSYAFTISNLDDSFGIVDISSPTSVSWVTHLNGTGAPNYLEGPVSIYVTSSYLPRAPNNLLATPLSSTEISLTWTLGSYSDYTGLYYKVGSYPSNRADGTRLYLGSTTSYSHQGLDPGTTYYYRAWGHNSATEEWSDSYDQDMATTLLGKGGGPPGPDIPPEWSQDPTCAVYENTPIFSILTGAADGLEVPQGTFCFGSTMLFIIMASVVGYLVTRRSEEVLLAVMAVGIIVAAIAGALPMWMIVFAILLGGGSWFLWKRV